MWHSFVSSIDTVANRIVLGFVETSWRYPFVTAGVLLVFLLLTAMLWIDILRKGRDDTGRDEAPPIRLRRW